MVGAIARDGPTQEEHGIPLRPWMRFVHVHYAVNTAGVLFLDGNLDLIPEEIPKLGHDVVHTKIPGRLSNPIAGLAQLDGVFGPLDLTDKMVLGYAVLRFRVSSPRLTTKETWTGQSQEMEVIGLAAASLFSKYRKIATFDELLERLFFTGKTCVAALLLFFGVPHLVSYLLVWAEVKTLSPGDFQSIVRSPAAHATGQQVTWLVMFHADWCSGSNNIQPMFGALARRHASKNRRFAHVDVVAYPEVAEDLNINTSGTSKQLPTLALFADGREVCRLPTFASDGRVVRARLDERGVTKYFELDREFKAASYARKSKGRGKS